nr:AAA family ATPase [Streptococcus gallolyticus]
MLDEPFNGLDPRGIKEFRELLIELSQRGVGIIISSHSLEELRKLVDTVTIINNGRVIFQGRIVKLSAHLSHKKLHKVFSSLDIFVVYCLIYLPIPE